MKERLTVIKGGRDISKENNGRRFIKGFVTATRLMGVIVLELTWDVPVNSKIETLNQIFYLDSEEYGIETYTQAYGNEPDIIINERNRLVGALGGAMTSVTEKEARFILQTHAAIGNEHQHSLPENRDKFDFLLKPLQDLNKEEYFELMQKECGNIDSEWFAINYFIMRSFAGDKRAAAYLLTDKSSYPEIIKPDKIPAVISLEDFINETPATLCLNHIKPCENDEDDIYICESLIESKNQYCLIVSEIHLKCEPFTISAAYKCSNLKISGTEAALLMDRSEFITVFDIVDPNGEMMKSFQAYVGDFTETQYENGTLYIDFNSTNEHAGNQLYRINDDIKVMYFITLTNQIIVIGYSKDNVYEAEFKLSLTFMPYFTVINMKYEFSESVIYEFMQSDFDYFESFVEYLGEHPE